MKSRFLPRYWYLPWFAVIGTVVSFGLAQEPGNPAIPAQPVGPAPLPVPPALLPWQDWVKWDDRLAGAPPAFNNAKERTPIWPGCLDLAVDAGGGRFEMAVRVYAAAWMPLPGGADAWPQGVRVDGLPAVVVERDGRPAVHLQPGAHRVAGDFPWKELPQGLPLPAEIGVLDLKVNGQRAELPNWDEKGFLWLKRARPETTEREFLAAQVYRVLEDGIPMWLRTRVELSVAGKSREVDLGHALPAGWRVATVNSPLPCAVDDAGYAKAQVRAGKWTIQIDAFRTVPAETISFADKAKPMVGEELIGFRAQPDFRVIEFGGIEAIDVSQTTFPEDWRNLPVYRWVTSKPFRIEEKMRGMGFQKPSGLSVEREFWLDDRGEVMTYRDRIKGTSQQSWRLDVSAGQTLGAARMAGEGQLVTCNPVTGASGVEVRRRNLDMEAVGLIANPRQFPATGWQADVERCEATLHLPPGWRVLALLGAETVRGDWVTAWTLLDLFLLLVFAMAVGRLWGLPATVVAVLGFGLTYHEPDAPRWLWFFLLIPVAILRVIPRGRARTAVEIWRAFAVAVLMVSLVPFVGRQLQGVLYPQLEPVRAAGLPFLAAPRELPEAMVQRAGKYLEEMESSAISSRNANEPAKKWAPQQDANLAYDAQARIQTGPAVPTWSWREIRFGWRGPVTPDEAVRVLLIPPLMQRGITLLRVLMLILLAAVLVEASRLLPPFLRRKPKLPPPAPPGHPAATAAMVLLALLLGGAPSRAQAQGYPPQQMLDKLRERLAEMPDAFPHAAEIPFVKLKLEKHSLVMDAEIHAASQTAVPLPGRLPAWSPVSVQVDGQPAEAAGRRDGYLWVVLSPGSHQVRVEGLLPNVTEWEWTFLLAPRQISLDTPGWTVTGVKPNGVPEHQVFFAVKTPAVEAEAAYDRKDFTPAVEVERAIEMGLIWQVRTTLRRLSPEGKAVALSVPLLPGERVLSSRFAVTAGKVEARLGAAEKEVVWESELEQRDAVTLVASEKERWVERWRLIASPVWNVGFAGLGPVYEPGNEGLEPVWRPWPGERVELKVTRPEAIPGATMTVRSVEHSTQAGSRQRTGQLQLDLQASLAQEFALGLSQRAEVTSLEVRQPGNAGGARQPVRRDGSKVIIPVRPGEQTIRLEWKAPEKMGWRSQVDALELPVESSNIATTFSVPEDRWIVWTVGPLRGPAVRLWVVAALAVVGAFVLGRLRMTPLRGPQWALLALGLTQVHPAAALVVVGWLFLLAWRGTERGTALRPLAFNALQCVLLVGAIPVMGTLLAALHRGLLGTPDMMVLGNGSVPTELRWFAQRAAGALPQPEVFSVSIWYYRLMMLAWALWLAVSAIGWARWGWTQFAKDKLFKSFKPVIQP